MRASRTGRFPRPPPHIGMFAARAADFGPTSTRFAPQAGNSARTRPSRRREFGPRSAQLAAEGLIREPQPAAGWFAGWFGTPRRLVLTGAYAAFLLAAAGLAGYTGSSQPALATGSVSDDEASVAPELGRTLDGDLNRVIESLPDRDPALAASLRKNMGIVDNFIAVCEKSVREQPDNPVARDYLYGAYQQKAVLLATATDRTLEDR